MSDQSSPEQPVQAISPTLAAITGKVINDELASSLEDYRKARDALAIKFGGMIPIAQGEIASVDITQKGSDPAYVVVVLRTLEFDQIALTAAPNHKMRVVLFEDRRPGVAPHPG